MKSCGDFDIYGPIIATESLPNYDPIGALVQAVNDSSPRQYVYQRVYFLLRSEDGNSNSSDLFRVSIKLCYIFESVCARCMLL